MLLSGPYSKSKLPLPLWGSKPHLKHGSLGPHESICPTASRSVQPFLENSKRKVPILYSCLPLFSLKIAPSRGRIWTPFNSQLLGTVWIHIRNGISISSVVFAGLTIMTDWLTDRIDEVAWSVCLSVTDRQTNRQTDRQTDHATSSIKIGCI